MLPKQHDPSPTGATAITLGSRECDSRSDPPVPPHTPGGHAGLVPRCGDAKSRIAPTATARQLSPPTAGVGLKPDHYRAILERAPADLWLEVHPENYMVAGGPRLAWLDALRADRFLSFHGVGASLGGVGPLCPKHMSQLKSLIDRFEPELISEHVSWSDGGGVYFADLLPLPATRAALNVLASHVDEMQSALKRSILLENPSTYLRLSSDMSEPEFLVELARRTGCGLLIDVNNVYVSSVNLGFDPARWLEAIPGDLVGEIHVAGHAQDGGADEQLLIDTHGAPVADPVWQLLDAFMRRIGPRHVLLERDADIPPFDELMRERQLAQTAIARAAASVSCTL